MRALRGPARYAFVGGLLALSACTLLTDLDGLTSTAPAHDDEDVNASEAGQPDQRDASERDADEHNVDDAGDAANADAGLDAGPDGACKGTKGPTPVRVGTYCIDSTEVSAKQYQEFLAAKAGDVSGQIAECATNTTFAPTANAVGDIPVTGADWCDAVAYCTWAGKRLCGRIDGDGGVVPTANVNNAFSSEWYRACTFDGQQAYPYGNTRDASACNGFDYDAGTGFSAPRAVGSTKTCEGGYPGIFDMVGNLWEWENNCADGGATAKCQVRGSSFAGKDSTACATTFNVSRIGPAIGDTTIRCCSD